MFTKNVLVMREGMLEESHLIHGPVQHVVDEAAIQLAVKLCQKHFDPAYDDVDAPSLTNRFHQGYDSVVSGNDEYTVMVKIFTDVVEAGS